jgi:hypothetical protein
MNSPSQIKSVLISFENQKNDYKFEIIEVVIRGRKNCKLQITSLIMSQNNIYEGVLLEYFELINSN